VIPSTSKRNRTGDEAGHRAALQMDIFLLDALVDGRVVDDDITMPDTLCVQYVKSLKRAQEITWRAIQFTPH
jgi:hypothetical protein